MNFSVVEFSIIAILFVMIGLLGIGLYADAVSEKITLNKSEWVCTEKGTKLMLISGKLQPISDCTNYTKVGY